MIISYCGFLFYHLIMQSFIILPIPLTDSTHNTPYEKVGDAEPVSIADDLPFDIPETWEWARIKDVILFDVGGGTPDKSNPDYWGGNIPWMSVKDFSGAKEGVMCRNARVKGAVKDLNTKERTPFRQVTHPA